MKKILSLLLVMMLLCPSSVFATSEEVTEDLSLYQNNEVLVMYKDGRVELMTFESDLQKELKGLAENEDVILYQPNYSYQSEAEAYQSRQWGIENDGTFYMEERQNEFPVFDQPFGDAKQPGKWQPPDDYGRPGGGYRKHTGGYDPSVTAVENIDINLTEATDLYHDSGKEVIVAMVDTGVDFTHEDLQGRIWTNEDEIPNNGIDDDQNGYTDDVNGWNFYHNSNQVYVGQQDDHGTHGAGTVAAKENGVGILGINQSENVKVMSVKALGGATGSGSTASVIQAIRYAEQNGATICNLSLGTSNNDQALYHTIANSNMLFVVSAGNERSNTDWQPSYPASYELDNIISVANLNYDGTLQYSSNYGAKTVDLAAPGSYILSTTVNNGYSYMSGTSMAALFVSAVAAMVLSHFGDISLEEVKEILLSSVTPLDCLSETTLSGGMLNLANALSYSTDQLTSEEWEEKIPTEYTGTAPVLKGYTTGGFGGSYFILQVYDRESDVVSVSYAYGEQTTDYFGSGNEEINISLDRRGTAAFHVSSGVYTFYAVDSKGNETVYTVSLQERKRQEEFLMDDFFRYIMW